MDFDKNNRLLSSQSLVSLGLLSGTAVPIIFWSKVFICSMILGNYNHVTRMVSELGELGTRSQYVFTAGLVLCAILSLYFTFTLIWLCKQLELSCS